MLVNKKHEKQCGLCAWADRTAGGEMLCYHKGPVRPAAKCFRFRYDPFKRTPPVAAVVKEAKLAALEEAHAD